METDEVKLQSDAVANEFRFDELQSECREFILATACSLIIRNDTMEIIYITPEAEESFGYVWNELVGKNINELLPENLRTVHTQHIKQQGVVAKGRQMGFGRTVQARSKDGSLRSVYIRLTSKFAINKRNGQKTLWTKADLIFSPPE